MFEVELADESPHVSDPDPVVDEVRDSAGFRAVMRSLPQFFEGGVQFCDSCCDEGNHKRGRSK